MLVNFAAETISAGGTGNLTLSGAVDSAHVTINTAIGQTHYFIYVIDDGNNREVGVGHLSASTTLVRDKILETIVSGTLDNTSPAAITASTSSIVSIKAAGHGMMPSMSQYYDTDINGCEGISCNMFATGVSNLSHGVITDTAYITPCFLPFPMLVSSVDIYCKIAAASSGAHVGAYTRASNGRPGTLFANFTSGGAIDTSTTGAKTATLGTPVLFPGGQFWMALLTNSSTTEFRAVDFTQSANHNVGLDSSGNYFSMYTKGTTYGTLPSTFASFSGDNTGQFCFWLR